jgi:hypothetical protein
MLRRSECEQRKHLGSIAARSSLRLIFDTPYARLGYYLLEYVTEICGLVETPVLNYLTALKKQDQVGRLKVVTSLKY